MEFNDQQAENELAEDRLELPSEEIGNALVVGLSNRILAIIPAIQISSPPDTKG